ncbi:GGDEF domain-containing protein [Massilia antarctica]|uniref:GGDEF domain-containing protein n=1 Tax=Massilia antarctica TaxID=2765360 RepID=UPI0006BB944E|nr:GGDEF domain-containing protein [Massilia sp. H27-R4]MCY0912725.1 GGDEF domain-containing protein [Massilia sp. H27-R4]CUI03794.1 diguanylate cyclase/phosphodiesterase (GGDEF & EAL domains) with PAS/PAC sensor(s) [Janthinobacterium sp. CG23_2]CUU27580.1 diguanylate cyclase/phosphodiesterase (GGDEF & EAL domains) with PAS/PAC sensor(s) [Janthinobacterium sp. CG23_2]
MDITTMLFALALGNLSLAAALFFYEYERGKSLSWSTWAIAKQCQAVAWLLLYFNASGVVPDAVSIPAGYAVLFAGVGLEAGALWEAAGRLAWRRVAYPVIGASVALFLVCYVIDEAGMRVVAGALILGGLHLASAAALARGWRAGSMLHRFLVIAIASLALLVAARGILVLTMPGGWGWLSKGLLQVLTSGALYLLMLFNGYGFLLLAREQQRLELERLSLVDGLTDLPNRRSFFAALAPWMALARRPGQPSALVMLDFDQFKRVNDSYGHPAGDTVLRSVAEVCKRQLRDSDQLGRMVGVEFALLLPRTGLDEALLVAERIRAAVEASPVKTERAMISMTASFGVTVIRPEDSTVSLFKRADEALRMAKQGGRNKVVAAPGGDASGVEAHGV